MIGPHTKILLVDASLKKRGYKFDNCQEKNYD